MPGLHKTVSEELMGVRLTEPETGQSRGDSEGVVCLVRAREVVKCERDRDCDEVR